MNKVLTLCLVYQHPNILLGMKKRGFGVGKWNGFGGKVDIHETIEEAAIREIQEEAGISVQDINKLGVLEFEFMGDPEILEVNIFRSEKYLGEPSESEEMRPQWFHIDEIPYSSMWPDDQYWLPLFLAGKKFNGRFLFGDNNVILKHTLKEIDNL